MSLNCLSTAFISALKDEARLQGCSVETLLEQLQTQTLDENVVCASDSAWVPRHHTSARIAEHEQRETDLQSENQRLNTEMVRFAKAEARLMQENAKLRYRLHEHEQFAVDHYDAIQRFEADIEWHLMHMSAVIDAMPDYIFVIGLDGVTINYCNDKFALACGGETLAQFQNRSIFDVFSHDVAAYFLQQNQQVFATGKPLHVVETLTLPTGVIHVDTHKVPLFDESGSVYALLGASHDVTEMVNMRQQLSQHANELEKLHTRVAKSEQFLQSILDHMRAFIIVLDQDGCILKSNTAWQRMLSKKSEYHALLEQAGWNWFSAVQLAFTRNADTASNPRMAFVAQAFERLRIGEIAEFQIELKLDISEDERWFDFSMHQFIHEEEKYFLAKFINVTERKLMEMETALALQREQQLNELRARFLSKVSHEFRTPMTIIQTSTDLLLKFIDKMPPEKRIAQLERVQMQVWNLVTMVDEVSVINKVQLGAYALSPALMDVTLLLTQIAEDAASVWQRPDAVEITSFDAGEFHCIDEALFRQIFNNLISNALKYSPEGTIVHVRWRAIEGCLYALVSDDGIGITPEDQAHLFEPFFRSAEVKQIPGTGLGLNIVKQAVDTYGGAIKCKSIQGKGTRFIVALPLLSERYARS